MALILSAFCVLQSPSLVENQTSPQLIMFSTSYKKDTRMLSRHYVSQIGTSTAKASSLKAKRIGFGAAFSISKIRELAIILESMRDSTL